MTRLRVAAYIAAGLWLVLPWRTDAAGPLPPAGGAPTAPAAPVAVEIAPHRAIYVMSLDRAVPSSGVVGASGTMVFEWGDVCDGWTVNQRYKLVMQYTESDPVELDISFVTWESKDGKRYRFNVRKLNDGEVEEELKGDGRMPAAGKPGEAQFTKPEKIEMDLPVGTEFPSGHTVSLIRAGLKGERFMPSIVFDGGTHDGPFDVSAAIGNRQDGTPNDANELLRAPWWPVRLAFFPVGGQDETPDYELRLELQQNGVARSMLLDYGNFVVRAKLEKLEPIAKPPC